MQPMSYNAWLYTLANPTNYDDPSGLCIHCQINYHVGVDTRGFTDRSGRSVSTEMASAIYTEPRQDSDVIARLSDHQPVIVLSRTNNDDIDWAWRQVLTAIDGNMYYGWVYNRILLDNCSTGVSGGFGCMPIDFSFMDEVYGFGPNKYAASLCAPLNYDCKWYANLRGLHNGLDFTPNSAHAIQPLIWAGTGNGKVVSYFRDAEPAIGVVYNGMTVVYGHRSYSYVGVNDEVRPGQLIGLTGLGHLHFGVRRGSVYYNPLNFFPAALKSQITSLMTGDGGYSGPYDPYYMVSFDNQYQSPKEDYWFWGTSCKRWAGIERNYAPNDLLLR